METRKKISSPSFAAQTRVTEINCHYHQVEGSIRKEVLKMMHETKLSHFNDVMSEYTDGECGGRLTPDLSLESKVVIKYLIYSFLHAPEHVQRVMTNADMCTTQCYLPYLIMLAIAEHGSVQPEQFTSMQLHRIGRQSCSVIKQLSLF